jgi:hypothetical protein
MNFVIFNFSQNTIVYYLNFFRNENEDIDNEAKSRNKMKSLNNLKLTDIKGKIINTKDVKVKDTVSPVCQLRV